MKHKHSNLWMAIGCILPFLLLFLLPALGVSNGVTYILFGVLMVGCHLLMGHGMGRSHKDDERSDHDSKP